VIGRITRKANTINKYLGKDFVVKLRAPREGSAQGKLGVDLDNDFEPVYELIPGKEKVIKELRTAAKTAGIFSAAGSEGEAILPASQRNLDATRPKSFAFFQRITPKAIRAAMEHPAESISISSMHAGPANPRSSGGYKISPLLWARCAAASPPAGCRQSRFG